jgi:hypothetical protein
MGFPHLNVRIRSYVHNDTPAITSSYHAFTAKTKNPKTFRVSPSQKTPPVRQGPPVADEGAFPVGRCGEIETAAIEC